MCNIVKALSITEKNYKGDKAIAIVMHKEWAI
jgi:hypothetical protein